MMSCDMDLKSFIKDLSNKTSHYEAVKLSQMCYIAYIVYFLHNDL